MPDRYATSKQPWTKQKELAVPVEPVEPTAPVTSATTVAKQADNDTEPQPTKTGLKTTKI